MLLCFGGNDGERDRAWYDLAGHCWLDCHALDAAAGQWRRVDAPRRRGDVALPLASPAGDGCLLFSNGDGALRAERLAWKREPEGDGAGVAQDAAAAIARSLLG